MTDAIVCNLAENAIDFLVLAGEHAKEGSPRKMKHALATLADGIELLLKARLEQRDWPFIFKNIDQASQSKYECGDFESVAFDQLVGRLERLCDVEIAPSHLAVLKELRQLRHRIRHFAVKVERAAALSLIAKTFSFAVDFVTEQLEWTSRLTQNGIDDLRTLLSEFDEFVDQRMTEIEPEFASRKGVAFIPCPTCVQRAFFADGGMARCLFCGHWCDDKDAAKEWQHAFGDSLSQVKNCPKCAWKTCVDATKQTEGDVHYVCLRCGHSGDYHTCNSCEALCLGYLCDDCESDEQERHWWEETHAG